MVEITKVLEIIATSGLVDDMSKFDPNKTFRENGVDSLDVFSIFLAVEEQLGIKFSNEEVERIDSVVQMVEAINY